MDNQIIMHKQINQSVSYPSLGEYIEGILCAPIQDKNYEIRQRNLSKKMPYALFFLKTSILGLIRKQAINVASIGNKYFGNFEITNKEIDNWKKTFKVKGEGIPFTFYLKSSTLTFLKLISDLGINPKNLLQLRNELKIVKSGVLFKPGAYKMEATVVSISPTGKKNAILKIASNIMDNTGELLFKSTDFFMIRNLSNQDIQQIKDENQNIDTSYRNWLIAPKYTQEEVADTKSFFVPTNMGINYGFVSGDLNIVHTTKFLAKLFGFKRAFIQGLCTANIVMSQLAIETKLDTFSINFTKPVFTKSEIKIEYTSKNFKVLNANNCVLAHGTL